MTPHDEIEMQETDQTERGKTKIRLNGKSRYGYEFLRRSIGDIFYLNRYLFTWDTLRITWISIPFYLSARRIDERIQAHFFDQKTKKNKRNAPKWAHELARLTIMPPMVFFGLQAFLSRNDTLRISSQVFLLGLPFVLAMKDLAKKLRVNINLRPFHEKFSPHERCSGGFPSGHVAEAAYTATLFGIRYGARAAVPLGLATAFVGGVFLASNRHYFSQLVAGAVFGVIYGFAANKVIDLRLDEIARKKDISVGLAEDGKPGLSVSWNF
jgi:membrane-associated phospholipid phosphatase